MSIDREKICRLCLTAVTNEYMEIDELMKLMFEVLLLKLDVNINRNPIICQNCVDVAKKCLIFKSTCFDTERIILLFSIGNETVKQNINIIYKERVDVKTAVEDLDICRICMTQLEKNNFSTLDSFRNDTTIFGLSEYLPEVDFNIIENAIICTSCRENLEDYFKFVLNCLDTERKIKSYLKEVPNENMGQVNLNDVLHCLFKDGSGLEKYPQVCAIKEESNMFEELECVYPEVYSRLINLEELDIKDSAFKKNNYSSNKRMLKCSLCAYKSKRTCTLNRHMLVHKDVSELKMHKCSLCAHETKHKSNLKNHIMLVHKDFSEITTHKCSLCPYETNLKSNLKRHNILIHKDVSELEMYKCSLCTYESKEKRTLDRHLLVHKDVSQLKMYKCSLCTYKGKLKHNLKRHMLVHNDVCKLNMYKCSLCTYTGKLKHNLKRHMSVHKNVSALTMYECSLCPYKSKEKRYLKKHLLVHRDVSELKMYKCSLCPYEVKQKRSLKRHLLVHKDVL